MDARAMMLQYAAEKNDRKAYTDAQFCGKMATEGVRINTQDAGATIARAKRTGNVIVITETKTVDGWPNKVTTETEVMRIEL